MARRLSALASWTGIVILLALVACGQRVATPVAEITPGTAVQFGSLDSHLTPSRAPTVDVAAKNLTATALRPSPIAVTHGPLIPGTPSHDGAIIDHVSFIDKLRNKGCTVTFPGIVQQPFLRGSGTIVQVSGCMLAQSAELQSFWYHTDDLHTDGLRAAEEDARGIDATGQPSGMVVEWAAPPHFFRKERAFVLFLGDDPALLALLTKLLGPQFAGR